MKQSRRNSGIRNFLEPYLASGDEKAIAEARKAYTRAYKASWRNKQRKRTISVTVSFTPLEAGRIFEHAKALKRSKVGYVKAASLAYRTQQFIVPDLNAIGEIRELLVMNYTALQELLSGKDGPTKESNELLQRYNELENRVLSSLQYPKTIFELLDELMNKKAGMKERLIEYFKKLSG